jgi:LssY C-terminus
MLMLLNRVALACGIAIGLLKIPCLNAQMLPDGATLEVRLLTSVGSRTSHAGDPVRATLIAPVGSGPEYFVSPGAVLTGSVTDARAVGFGLKRDAASLSIRFDSVQLAGGVTVPIEARLLEVETAREHVNEDGSVVGIHPAANLSSGLSFLISTALVHSELIGPAVIFKFLAVRSPDAEIAFPRGTELIVKLTRDVMLRPAAQKDENAPAVSAQDLGAVEAALDRLPVQQTERSGHRISDPVNVALVGTPEQVEDAFRSAGWHGESPHSVLSLYRLYHCMVQRMGYSTAPMSRLVLNGALPTRSFQKSLDTLSRRHHVRLWRQGDTNVWLGAATEDVRLGIRAMHVTHTIDANIDNERAKVVNDLWFEGCVSGASLVQPGAVRGAGKQTAAIITDGRLALVRLQQCLDSAGGAQFLRASRRERMASAARALASDFLRANPVTVGLVVAGTVARLREHRPEPIHYVRRPSIARERDEQLARR